MAEARRYAELAELAHEFGYPKVTKWAIQGWIKADLLGAAEPGRPPGGRRRTISATDRIQVRTLCRLRYDEGIRSLPMLAVALWFKRLPVPLEAVRAGLSLLADPSRQVAARTRVAAADVWDLVNIAVHERGFGAEAIRDGASRADLSAGLGSVFAVLAGDMSSTDPEDAELGSIAILMDLDRAAHDKPFGASPWLAQPPVPALRGALDAVATARLQATIAGVTDVQLELVRSDADLLWRSLIELAARLASGGGEGLAGLGLVARMSESPLALAYASLAILAAGHVSTQPPD